MKYYLKGVLNMENNIVTMEALRTGAEAGFETAKSDSFDKETYMRNIKLTGEWAERVNLDATVGNIYAVCVIAVLRTILGDEAFDTTALDENGEFSEAIMEKVQDKLLTGLGLRVTGDKVEKIHDEPTAE